MITKETDMNKRQELLRECETYQEEEMANIALDYFGSKFSDIQSLLESISLDNLDHIGEARDIAKEASSEIF